MLQPTNVLNLDYNCDKCDKSLVLRRTLKKHMHLHTQKNIPTCYYFSNKRNCPFEEYGCKFLHESKEPTDKSIDEQDAFKHLTTSTPVKVDDKITQCKICIQNINPGQKFYKCEECEHKIYL